MTHRVLFARQPIFDSDKEIVAFELLYRHHNSAERAEFPDGDEASATVLLNTLAENELGGVVGKLPVFVNFTENLLLSKRIPRSLAGKVVIEVLEDVQVSESLVEALRELRDQGFVIALDDFEYAPAWDAILNLATYVKLDIMALGKEGVQAQLKKLERWPGLRYLAEKIETVDELRWCVSQGIELYQGYFLAKPMNVTTQEAAIFASQKVVVQLLAELQNPDVSTAKVSEYLAQDVRLSYKLIKLINSVFYGLRRPIDSVDRAVVYLGIDETRNWVSLLALSRLSAEANDVLQTAMVRARMCYNLADPKKTEHRPTLFAAGLFSVLPALLGRTLDDILAAMGLSVELTTALLHQEGAVGRTLKTVLAYEAADWPSVEQHREAFPGEWLMDAYLESLEWSARFAPHLQEQSDEKPHAPAKR